MEQSSPQEILEDLMEVEGIKQVDLVEILDSKGVVLEVVNEKCFFTLAQAQAL